MAKARYIMIGGFLGAGKTTAVLKLAKSLSSQQLKLGLITNDQAMGLVDTKMLASHGFAVEEIAGGCFCCRFNSLVQAADNLSKDNRPDVFIAEPVGSCTDLVATVSYPLRRIYKDNFTIAPLSVMIDPIRALRILGVEVGKKFSKKVLYIYQKQLEEANIIVVNKCDLLEEKRQKSLIEALKEKYPQAQLIVCSAREEIGLKQWFDIVTSSEIPATETMEVNYKTYAQGEALLGWLNCTIAIAGENFDGNEYLESVAKKIQNLLSSQGGQIAHLKMTLAPENSDNGELGVVNLVDNDYVPELSHQLLDMVVKGQLVINLRAESAPEVLRSVTQEALKDLKVSANIEHIECFKPGKPVPTHRFSTLD